MRASSEAATSVFNEDFYQVSVPAGAHARAAELVVEYASERVSGRYPQLDPTRDIQVLVPQHPGPVGSQVLNQRLESALNPAPAGREKRLVLKRGELSIYVGSKVIQTRNQYTDGFELMNGQIALVRDYDPDEETCCSPWTTAASCGFRSSTSRTRSSSRGRSRSTRARAPSFPA